MIWPRRRRGCRCGFKVKQRRKNIRCISPIYKSRRSSYQFSEKNTCGLGINFSRHQYRNLSNLPYVSRATRQHDCKIGMWNVCSIKNKIIDVDEIVISNELDVGL